MSETEKITINLSVVDLGKIELLVEEGFYANRTDLIRTAIRNLLLRHDEAVQRTVVRRALVLGALHYGREALERLEARGERVAIRVLGTFTLGDDVSPELARATIESIKVLGVFRAGKELKQALADRIE